MRPILLAALALAFAGCAQTKLTILPDGTLKFRTHADATNLRLTAPGGYTFSADRLDHSTPTLAQGKAASDKLAAGGGAIAASGILALFK